MPRIDLRLVQGAGKPAFAGTFAVSKANPAGIVVARLASGSAPPTTVFNVTAAPYNADRTGVTPAQTAIQAAFTAAHNNSRNGAHSTVHFPPGTYLVSGRWDLPTIRTNDWVGATSPTLQRSGVVTLSGYGATIKYANVAVDPPFCWLQTPWVSGPLLQYQTYGNMVIEGFTIDNNWRQPSTQASCVFHAGGCMNVDNVTIRDITMTNNITARTAAIQPRQLGGIGIVGSPVNRSQAHWGYCTNITIDNCTIYHQAGGIGIYANDDNEAVCGLNPYMYDNINISNCYVNGNHHYGANILLGSYGAGYRCSVSDTTCVNSCDDGLEINAFNEVHVTDCHFEQNRQPVCFTRFSQPYKTDKPHYHMKGNTYSGLCNSYWMFTVDAPEGSALVPMLPELRHYRADAEFAPLLTREWGDIIVEDQVMEYGFANTHNANNYPITLGSNGMPISSATVKNCSFTDKQSSASTDFIYIRQGTMGQTLPITITGCRWRNTTGGAYAPLAAGQVALSGARTVTTDIGGLT
jgi:hypothetical protein